MSTQRTDAERGDGEATGADDERRMAAAPDEPSALESAPEPTDSDAEQRRRQALALKVRIAETKSLREALARQRERIEHQRERLVQRRERDERQRKQLEAMATKLEAMATELEAVRARAAAYLGALPRRRLRTTLRLIGLVALFRLRDVRAYLTIRRSGQFDATYYLTRYPEVAVAGENPILDYVERGASEGRNPRNDFDTSRYLAAHPELAATGQNPFLHHLRSTAPET